MKFYNQLQPEKSISRMSLMIVFLFLLAACSQTAASAPSLDGAPAAVPKTKLRFQLGWIQDYSFAGFAAAERNGHFAEQGLEVTFIEGGFNEQGYIDPVSRVLAGEADLSNVSISDLLAARAAGKPVVAVGSSLQRSPNVIISRAEDNIVRPSDLRGKRVAVTDGGARAIYEALILSQGIDLADIDTIPRVDFGIDPLLKGEVDALWGWITNEGVLIQEANVEANFILPSDYGIDTYPGLIFTTETMLAEQPEVIERFLRAMIQGHQDVLDDPQQALGFVLDYNKKLVREEQERRLQAFLPLIKPPGTVIGQMRPEVWQLMYQISLDHGLLSTPVELEAAYTLEFLEKIYSETARR
jgi:NitT/TauT family transport system substrate-binding protein